MLVFPFKTYRLKIVTFGVEIERSLENQMLSTLISQIQQYMDYSHLDLSGKNLTLDDVRRICSDIPKNSSLKKITLAADKITPISSTDFSKVDTRLIQSVANRILLRFLINYKDSIEVVFTNEETLSPLQKTYVERVQATLQKKEELLALYDSLNNNLHKLATAYSSRNFGDCVNIYPSLKTLIETSKDFLDDLAFISDVSDFAETAKAIKIKISNKSTGVIGQFIFGAIISAMTPLTLKETLTAQSRIEQQNRSDLQDLSDLIDDAHNLLKIEPESPDLSMLPLAVKFDSLISSDVLEDLDDISVDCLVYLNDTGKGKREAISLKKIPHDEVTSKLLKVVVERKGALKKITIGNLIILNGTDLTLQNLHMEKCKILQHSVLKNITTLQIKDGNISGMTKEKLAQFSNLQHLKVDLNIKLESQLDFVSALINNNPKLTSLELNLGGNNLSLSSGNNFITSVAQHPRLQSLVMHQVWLTYEQHTQLIQKARSNCVPLTNLQISSSEKNSKLVSKLVSRNKSLLNNVTDKTSDNLRTALTNKLQAKLDIPFWKDAVLYTICSLGIYAIYHYYQRNKIQTKLDKLVGEKTPLLSSYQNSNLRVSQKTEETTNLTSKNNFASPVPSMHSHLSKNADTKTPQSGAQSAESPEVYSQDKQSELRL